MLYESSFSQRCYVLQFCCWSLLLLQSVSAILLTPIPNQDSKQKINNSDHKAESDECFSQFQGTKCWDQPHLSIDCYINSQVAPVVLIIFLHLVIIHFLMPFFYHSFLFSANDSLSVCFTSSNFEFHLIYSNWSPFSAKRPQQSYSSLCFLPISNELPYGSHPAISHL